MKVDILAFGAHPDDVEMGCGGTVAKSIAAGTTVGIIDLTKGELGTNGNVELRDQEAKTAASILGAKFRVNLSFDDGFIFNNKENQIEIVKTLLEAGSTHPFVDNKDDFSSIDLDAANAHDAMRDLLSKDRIFEYRNDEVLF